MKILTIGISPYLLTSQAKVNAMIMKHLYSSGYSITGIVKHHDVVYFPPEELSSGKQTYFYESYDCKIPIVPLVGKQDPSIEVYEIVKQLKPDVLITIGDVNDFPYMNAVRMFCEHSFKWLSIMMNYSRPINENSSELISEIDGILCTSEHGLNLVKDIFVKDHLEFSYVGTDIIKKDKPKVHDKFRIMTTGKNCQADNIPLLMEVVGDLYKNGLDIELYVHSNVHDRGDFDLNLLKTRFDPNDEFIIFPEKYVSLIDGYSEEDFQNELVSSDLFVSIPVNVASGLTVFDSMACGCIPLMSDVGCHGEIAKNLGNRISGLYSDDYLVPCIDLMVRGEVYLGICNPKSLRTKIENMYHKIKLEKEHNNKEKAGYRKDIKEFALEYQRDSFLKKVIVMVEEVYKVDALLCVESV